MEKKGFDWRKIIFAVAVAMLFVPTVYLGVNTFFPEGPDYTECEDFRLQKPCAAEDDACYEAQDQWNKESRDCYRNVENERKKYDGWKYVIVVIISIIASLVMLLNLDKSIIYGLFFGVVITAFSGTLTYMHARSLIGFILMLVLFVIMIFFIQRERRKT